MLTEASSQSNIHRESINLMKSSSLENVESDYIKNLQQQIYFLEIECNYLRQLANINGSNVFSITEKINNIIDKDETNKTTRNYEKAIIKDALYQIEKNYERERELLLAEISKLKHQKYYSDYLLSKKNTENLKNNDIFSSKYSEFDNSATDKQLENVQEDNFNLRVELNECRNKLISRDSLINEIQKSKETEKLKQELIILKKKFEDAAIENKKLSSSLENSLKQNEEDLLMAKKNLDLAKLNLKKVNNELENQKIMNKNLLTQIEQHKKQEKLNKKNQSLLKERVDELENSNIKNKSENDNLLKNLGDRLRINKVEFDKKESLLIKENNKLLLSNNDFEKKINDLNEMIDNNKFYQKISNEEFKSIKSNLLSELEESHLNLISEKNLSSNMQLKINNLQRQEDINVKLISSLKLRISELESQLNEYILNENILKNKLTENTEMINTLQQENYDYAAQIKFLNGRLEEIDQLKNIEDLIHTERWSELGKLAVNIAELSKSMQGSNSLFKS